MYGSSYGGTYGEVPEPITTPALTLPALALVTEPDPTTVPALTLDALALVEEAEAITVAALVLPAVALVALAGEEPSAFTPIHLISEPLSASITDPGDTGPILGSRRFTAHIEESW